MSKKKWVLGLACALLLAGSVAVVAGIGGGDDNTNSNLNFGDDLPDGGGCFCPHVYDPVVCVEKNPDGTFNVQQFSNGCFAGCAGFTNCFSGAVVR